MCAWFSERFARTSELPDLEEFVEDLFGEEKPPDPEEEERQAALAGRAWNQVFAAIRQAPKTE